MTSLWVHPSTGMAELYLCGWEMEMVGMLETKSAGLNKNVKMGFLKGLGVSWTLPEVDKHLQLKETT